MASDSLAEVVKSGDYKRSLEALRDRLAGEIEADKADQKGSEVASLAKQLADVLKTLAAMPAEREKSKVDDLSKRRAARRKGAETPKRSAQRVRGGTGGNRASS